MKQNQSAKLDKNVEFGGLDKSFGEIKTGIKFSGMAVFQRFHAAKSALSRRAPGFDGLTVWEPIRLVEDPRIRQYV